jgi:hypothetical protein
MCADVTSVPVLLKPHRQQLLDLPLPSRINTPVLTAQGRPKPVSYCFESTDINVPRIYWTVS